MKISCRLLHVDVIVDVIVIVPVIVIVDVIVQDYPLLVCRNLRDDV